MEAYTPNFIPFPKLARLSRECVITEKLDGTNAQVFITDDGQMFAGSRSKYLQPGKQTDNFGFAAWVEENKEELLKLGTGRHFGEWYGKGIQRGYGLNEKRFALFNVGRWNLDNKPSCCHVVSTLYTGLFDDFWIEDCIEMLAKYGSRSVPGFLDPEGIVIFHAAANVLFKKTIKNDEQPKQMAA